MSTIHNPTNFEPKDYEVEDYLDNQRPQFFGQDNYEQEVKWWEESMRRALGADWLAKKNHCAHCGNSNVRWITACRHIPTGEVVVFGAVCTDRLGFANKVAFKLAQLQARAEARKVRFTIWNKREGFLTSHPSVKDALEAAKLPLHAKNFFLHDVLAKLDRYGELSEKQVAAITASIARDRDYAAKKEAEATEVKGDAPSGRVEVTGIVLTLKSQEGYMGRGEVLKMLLKLENNSKVWLTCTEFDIHRGDKVTVKATFEVSHDDKSFAFGKRPIISNIVHDEFPDGSLPPTRAQNSEVQR